MNIKQALCQAHRDLGSFLEAEVLLKSCLGVEREDLYLNPDRVLAHRELHLLEEVIGKRKNRLPLAHIMGNKEFYSLEFKVTPDTFIPRPETEFLIDAILNIVYGLRFTVYGKRLTVNSEAKGQAGKRLINIVDLGTGCGNIAITLAKHIQNSRIWATDVSKETLEVAKENAKEHGVEDKITFLAGNLFAPLKGYSLKNEIDFLVSNPPYVTRREIDFLVPEVADYEPRIALDGGASGLSFYRRIIRQAAQYLKPGGYLLLELGINQAFPVREIIEKTLTFESIEIVKDYSGIDRVIISKKTVDKS